jgi:uncharacterized protein
VPVLESRSFVVVLVGLAAGTMSGLLGVGGGIVMVPLLVALMGLTQHQAHATSLAAIIPIAAVGALAFELRGNVDHLVAVLLAAGALVGAPLGARAMAELAPGTLRAAFGVLMILVGLQMVIR